jgi:hypothetical protein
VQVINPIDLTIVSTLDIDNEEIMSAIELDEKFVIIGGNCEHLFIFKLPEFTLYSNVKLK